MIEKRTPDLDKFSVSVSQTITNLFNIETCNRLTWSRSLLKQLMCIEGPEAAANAAAEYEAQEWEEFREDDLQVA